MNGFNERTKRQIALLAGEDLEGVQAEEIRRSVDSCPKCRKHWTRVRGCLDVLERVGKQADPVAGASLWPAVESRLAPRSVLRSERFNGWIPALSMAAACIALLIAGQADSTPHQDAVDGGLPGVSPVMYPSQPTFPGGLPPREFQPPFDFEASEPTTTDLPAEGRRDSVRQFDPMLLGPRYVGR